MSDLKKSDLEQYLSSSEKLNDRCLEIIKWLHENAFDCDLADDCLIDGIISFMYFMKNDYLISYLTCIGYELVLVPFIFPERYLYSDEWKQGILDAVESGVSFNWFYDCNCCPEEYLNEYQLA